MVHALYVCLGILVGVLVTLKMIPVKLCAECLERNRLAAHAKWLKELLDKNGPDRL
jgi:hypothetical protein